MTKKIFVVIILLIVGLITFYFAVFLVQNFTLEHSLIKNYNKGDKVSDYKNELAFIRCNYNILDPEFATIFFIRDEGNIGFYKPKKILFGSHEDWDTSYTGGTTVKNTTFPKLVKMVKEDCSQFQADYNNPDPNGIDWGYREAEPPEPPKTEEELEEDAKRDFFEQVRGMKYIFSEVFTDYQQEKFSEMYGDINSMTDDEIFSIKKSINENGGLEVVFKEYLFDENGNVIFRKQEE